MTATSSLSHGRTVIPAALREQLGVKDVDQLIWEVRDGELLVTTRVAQLRRAQALICLLYTSDAADERSSVDLGGRRIIKKKIQLTRHTR